jgi:hypothetical protein
MPFHPRVVNCHETASVSAMLCHGHVASCISVSLCVLHRLLWGLFHGGMAWHGLVTYAGRKEGITDSVGSGQAMGKKGVPEMGKGSEAGPGWTGYAGLA